MLTEENAIGCQCGVEVKHVRVRLSFGETGYARLVIRKIRGLACVVRTSGSTNPGGFRKGFAISDVITWEAAGHLDTARNFQASSFSFCKSYLIRCQIKQNDTSTSQQILNLSSFPPLARNSAMASPLMAPGI